jgi:hypothetical protein
MRVQSALPAGRALERLFAPGIRLGWTFRDRRTLAAPYREPRPDPARVSEDLAERAVVSAASYARARRWMVKPSLLAGLVLLLLAGYAQGAHQFAATFAALAGAVVVAGSGALYTIRCRWRQDRAAAAAPEQSYRQALADWQRRADAHQAAELDRLGPVPEWTTASPPTLRTDVFGGSLPGWRALLITHGTSILAAGPLLVMDLSGQFASRDLTAAAQAAAVPAVQYVLPRDLGRCGLLSRLSPAQFADALAEAIHAGTPGGARADRAIDVRVLSQLAAALGGRVTPARLAAATQVALGQVVPPGLLSTQEQALLGGGLFPASYAQQIGPNLVRLDAFLADLARHTAPGPADPATSPDPAAYYTCLALDGGARSARAEMLAALAIGWLTVQVSATPATAPAVIIAGADEVTRPHLERLAGACERRGVPLTVMFRHLREDALHMLGGGTAAFMRLGHHTEAEQAAGYLGRQHKFVLSQLTATQGGNHTFTGGQSDGYGDSDTAASSWPEFSLGPGSASRSRGTSRNWSTSRSWADGTSWSDASTTQRVYEYAVEPAVLQNLPDQALLLALRGPAGPRLQAVECDPAIASLPGASARPLVPPARISTAQIGTAQIGTAQIGTAQIGTAQRAPVAPPGWRGPPTAGTGPAFRPGAAPQRS